MFLRYFTLKFQKKKKNVSVLKEYNDWINFHLIVVQYIKVNEKHIKNEKFYKNTHFCEKNDAFENVG